MPKKLESPGDKKEPESPHPTMKKKRRLPIRTKPSKNKAGYSWASWKKNRQPSGKRRLTALFKSQGCERGRNRYLASNREIAKNKKRGYDQRRQET